MKELKSIWQVTAFILIAFVVLMGLEHKVMAGDDWKMPLNETAFMLKVFGAVVAVMLPISLCFYYKKKDLG